MSIESELYTFLQTKSGVTALVGTDMYLGRRPRQAGALALTWHRISGAPAYSLAQETAVGEAIVQVDCWGEGPRASTQVLSLFEQVRLAISSFRGTWGSTYVNGCTIVRNPIERMIQPADGTDLWVANLSFDILVHYGQATAPV